MHTRSLALNSVGIENVDLFEGVFVNFEELIFNVFSVKSLVLVLLIWFVIFFYQDIKYRKYIASQLKDINQRLDLAFDELEKLSRLK